MAATEEVLRFEDFPGHSLTVVLFKDVTNSKELRDAVQAGSLSPECALANATLVPDLLVLHAAAYKALAASQRGELRTRSLHAELVFSLSGSKHIAETLGRYGINPDCRHILAARFDALPDEVQQMRSLVAGSPAPLAELPSLAEQQQLKKYLKVSQEELAIGSLADAQLMRIAARDC
ncbi:EKC KEOPS complex subunit Tprkb [Chlorella sorokiniana]|uniref:EKC KEOPS complex subunit Tprkb n=1 Tax=Chlorella sorokiniana TaxID=3076 RepID=A0A2P6TIK0_CHLSO|nr:EKC KEOPS complex subunit Tprkb [Chlorella sorokiniana]|eukprot:PRW39074.1 EKC KEOPS complex subunit Tprkb [Chlorella sorokiniana]